MIPVELSGFDWLVKVSTLLPASEDELELLEVLLLPVLKRSPEVSLDSAFRFVRVVTSCNPETLCIL